ncbi:hypothetical protein I3843_01G081800 [Carya illinoinensis]|uniref:CREG-like beta-barrel domain-containing protein n=1 Tax=Carya illinoinensis TaxID=32201 RepID=A0A8T1RLT3_CARIL|nr:uncharacterized protein LOC122312978 [Carya illinoinensis]KAG6667263.1 hypothetical protein CIPAW_01G089700 [Carya illinoinensis]KAG6730544.1 hypothetical protein I3842_01G085600 [Carya illinoinensis]KAG7994897.1 hypothetical protein I3843_01G081800 [Carya illinoinensis]
MDAVASSAFVTKFPETCALHNSPSSSIRASNKRPGSLKICETPHFHALRVLAHASEVPGGEDEESKPLNSGFGFLSEGSASLSRDNLDCSQSIENDAAEALKMDMSITTPGVSVAGGGNRAGLFRTPISGGVQSATSAHGLPRPALAVRNLMEQARFAHLCTVMSRMHHRREGYPFGSLVDFAPDSMGHPLFSFSPLAIHTRNLLADPRCTLVVQIPGWSGLSNARVTIFGDVYPLPEHQQEWAHKQYIAKHQQGPSQQWGNFYYFRMQNISDIYFIGGFGTVAWVDVNEYETLQPDKIAVDGGEQNLKELNAIFSKPLKELLSTETEVDDAALISIDSKGIDIRVRQGAQFNIQRISFEEGHAVETLEEAKAALWKLVHKGRVCNLQK